MKVNEFHANGACGAAMEELIEARRIIGAVLDLTTDEIGEGSYILLIYIFQ